MLVENPTIVDVPQVKGFTGEMTHWFWRIKLDAPSDSYALLCDVTDARIGSWSVEVGEFSELLLGKIPQENSRCVMVVVVCSSCPCYCSRRRPPPPLPRRGVMSDDEAKGGNMLNTDFNICIQKT